MKVVAVIAVRNGQKYIRILLNYLYEQNIQSYIIDNESTDKTVAIAKKFYNKGLLNIETLPYNNEYDWLRILETKKRVYETLDADWFIHHDVDEIFQSPFENINLCDAINKVDLEGYNCINFKSFVFVPQQKFYWPWNNYFNEFKYYYLFEPVHPYFMRAFKKGINASNINSGGHILEGEDIKLYPIDFISRHYIVLSQWHSYVKYQKRKHAQAGLKRGWHANRLNLKRSQMKLPQRDQLQKLEHINTINFATHDLKTKQYWDW